MVLRRATSFPKVTSERGDTSFPKRAATSFPNMLIHELEVHCKYNV